MKKITLLFYILFGSLQAGDSFEEKPFTVSSRAINISRQAAQEFEKMRDVNTRKGVKLLEDTLQDPSFKRLNLETQISIFLQLADGYHRQKEFQKEEEFLKKLLQNQLLEPYAVRLQSALGLFYLECSELEKAEAVLKALTKLHPKTLSKRDRDDIATLWDRLDGKYRALLFQAEKNEQQGNVQGAILLYEALYRACERKAFPKTESAIIRREMYLKIHLRLGECLTRMQRYDEALHYLLDLRNIPATASTKTLARAGLYLLAYVQNQVQEYAAAEATIAQYLEHEQPEHALLLSFAIALETGNEERRKEAESLLTTPLLRGQRELVHAKWCEEHGQKEEAHAKLQKLFFSPVLLQAFLQDGLLLMKEGDFEEAVLRFEEALRQKSTDNNATARLLKAAISCYIELAKRQSHRESAYIERAQSCLDALLRLVPAGDAVYESIQVALYQALLLHDKQAVDKLEALDPKKSHELIQLALALAKGDMAFIQKSDLLSAQYVLSISAFNPEKLVELLNQEPSSALDDTKDRLRVEALTYFDRTAAIESCQEFLKSYPKSAFRSEVFRLMAVQQLQSGAMKAAAETLELYLTEAPQASARDQVLFLLAHARSASHVEQAKTYRKELVRDYPMSPYAPHSFFLQFSEKEYQEGSPQALKHLEEFLARYPKNSVELAPLKILAHAYLGMGQKEGAHLIQAYTLYSQWAAALKEPFASSSRSIAEAALLREGSEASLTLLDQSIEADHPLFYKVKLQLAACVSDSNESLARKQLDCVLLSDRKKGGALKDFIRAHLLLGQIEMKSAKFGAAIQQFERAERKATGELLLEVRLAKSECLQKMGKFDEAILLLSQIINDSTASQLRLKAMFKRAELYEGQKRYELAIKQLEAAERFPGEWGQRAKEKLEGYYRE